MQDHKAQEEGTRQHIDNLQAVMENHYKTMRKQAGIEEMLENSDGSDQETEEVFKKLYPDSKHKLMDILTCKVKEPVKKAKSLKRIKPAQTQMQLTQRPPEEESIQQ